MYSNPVIRLVNDEIRNYLAMPYKEYDHLRVFSIL